MIRYLLAGLAAALPAITWAASPAQQEFSRVMALEPDAQSGAVFFGQCASCHGADGGGQVSGSVPRIAGQHYRVLVRQIVDFRHGTRWDVRMEGVATSHYVIPQAQDIADVAAYTSGLDRDGARGVGDGEYVERGAALYAAKCASCHGADGGGDGKKEIPRISGQHAAYVARQIYDAVDKRRPKLAHSHGKLFKPLEFADVLGLTDYIARMGWSPPPAAAPAPNAAQ